MVVTTLPLSPALTPADRKQTGTYYTSAEVARFLVDVAVRSARDRVLEPCFGEGVFLRAGHERLAALGGVSALVGVDLDRAAVEQAHLRLPWASVHLRDFFDVAAGELGHFDAVVGNPPFVRYQRWSGAARARGLARALEAGVKLPSLASAWAPFLVHATAHLHPGGRLAVVAPLELTYARYARPVVAHLCGHFSRVRVFLFDEPLFPELNEATVLLVAAGRGGRSEGVELVHVCRLGDLTADDAWSVPATAVRAGAWGQGGAQSRLYRLPEEVQALYRRVEPRTTPLGEVATLTIGYVTGGNDWFHLTEGEVAALGLGGDVCLGLRRGADLAAQGLAMNADDLGRLGSRDAHWLFHPREPLSEAAR